MKACTRLAALYLPVTFQPVNRLALELSLAAKSAWI
jgi:hypothetical protein